MGLPAGNLVVTHLIALPHNVLQFTGEAPWSSGRTLALDAAHPRSNPVGGENY